MPAEKISVTVDPDTWEQALRLPWARSKSDLVNEALRRLVSSERLTAVLDEQDAELGPVDPQLLEQARHKWRDG